MSAAVFADLRGEERIPAPDNVIKSRSGIFAICITDGHILLTWPPAAPDLPEFPGGGIDPGEDKQQALIREIEEEAAVRMDAIEPAAIHEQKVHYYSISNGEFWNYDQTYWLLKGDTLGGYFFEGERTPEDAVKSRWVPLEEFRNMKIHAMHQRAREALGL